MFQILTSKILFINSLNTQNAYSFHLTDKITFLHRYKTCISIEYILSENICLYRTPMGKTQHIVSKFQIICHLLLILRLLAHSQSLCLHHELSLD